MRIVTLLLGAVLMLTTVCTNAQSFHHRFTVKDDIEMTSYLGEPKLSPNGKWFLVLTQRGLLDKNVPEYTIWLWSTDEVASYVKEGHGAVPPKPIPIARIAGYKDGNIGGLRIDWLEDSSGIAYLSRTERGIFRLFRVDCSTRQAEALTPETENVTDFTFRGHDYVYAVSSPEIMEYAKHAIEGQAIDVTGWRLWDIYQPLAQHPERLADYTYSELWAFVNGKRFRVEDRKTGKPVYLYTSETNFFSRSSFTLSPDRRSLAVIMPVDYIPSTWVKYQAPVGYEPIMRPLFPAEIFGRVQRIDDNLENPDPAFRKLRSYYVLDLATGAATPIVNAPTGYLLDWNADLSSSAWSSDGQSLLLSNTFLPLDANTPEENSEREKHPCLSVYELQSRHISCVLPLKAGRDNDRFGLDSVRFDPGNVHRVIVDYTIWRLMPGAKTSAVFSQNPDGTWSEEAGAIDPDKTGLSISVKWQESASQPWKLVAEDKDAKNTFLLWDPNPQLADIEWGDSSLMRWKGEDGSEYTANLLKPPDFVPGKRYPLVIQTHGFLGEDRFITSGRTTTGYAAREMAGAGIVVAQIERVKRYDGSPEEGKAEVNAFVSLVKKLDGEGLIDTDKVGLIGWSRTVYHTFEALVAGRPKLAAASVIEGVNYGYWEYLIQISRAQNGDDSEREIGAAPFGPGLETWIKRSPMFNLDKVHTPLLMMTTGVTSVLGAWEPYASLYRQHKPVDLVLLKQGLHIESNPLQRLASQGTTVDWYRFWLQGHEDPDPMKKDQYRRWEHLRELQDVENKADSQPTTAKPN